MRRKLRSHRTYASGLSLSRRLGCLAIAAFGVVGVGEALAGVTDFSAQGYRYTSDFGGVGDNQQEGFAADCPSGEPLVGGGAHASGPFADATQVNTSRPFDDDDADGREDDLWSAYIDNVNSGDGGRTGTSFAICDKRRKTGDYRYVESAVLPALDTGLTGDRVRCPKGEPAVGGGVRSSGFLNDEMWVGASYPWDSGDEGTKEDDGWYAAVHNQTTGSPGQTIIIYAICDKRRQTGAYRYRRSSEVPSTEGTQVVGVVTCRAGEPTVGGGVLSSGGFAERMFVNSSYPWDSEDDGGASEDGWEARVDDRAGGGVTNYIVAFAICKR
jgi:hypothetical protein